MHPKNSESKTVQSPQVHRPTSTASISRTAPKSIGTVPSESIRHLCLATVAVAITYSLPLLRYPVGLLLAATSGWIVARTLGALRSHATAIGVSFGMLAALWATQLLPTPPPQEALAKTYRCSIQIHAGILLALILADGLDLAQYYLRCRRWQNDDTCPSANVKTPKRDKWDRRGTESTVQ